MSTTTLTNVQDQSTEVSGYVEYRLPGARCKDFGAYRLKPHPLVPAGHVYCAWAPGDGYDATECLLTLAGHQRMLDNRSFVAGYEQAEKQDQAVFVSEYQAERAQAQEQTALKYELEGYAHPDFVARYWDRYQSGDAVAISLVKGAVDMGRRNAYFRTAMRQANMPRSRREDFSFKTDTESNDYQGWTF